MGLFGDIKSRVILEYKADTEQAKIALRDLQGAQKKQAQAAVTGIEDQVKAHERLAGKITLGVGIAAGAIALGIQGFKKYEEHSRLSAATAGVSIDKLRQVSRGLMTDIELMGVAAAGANGKWKLTTAELQNVLGAARALELRGLAPLSEAAEKLGVAIKKGEVEPLKELGIAYDETLAKTDKRAAAMKAINALSEESARTTTTETEAIRAHGTEFRQTIDEFGTAIGKLVVSLNPLVGVFAGIADKVAQIATGLADIGSWGNPGDWKKETGRIEKDLGVGRTAGGFPVFDHAGSYSVAGIFNMAQLGRMTSGAMSRDMATEGVQRDAASAAAAAAQALAAAAAEARAVEARALRRIALEGLKPSMGARRAGGSGRDRYADAYGITDIGRGLRGAVGRQADRDALLLAEAERAAQAEEFGEKLISDLGGLGPGDRATGKGRKGSAAPRDPKEAKGPSAIERVFGPPGEIDAYVSALTALRDAAGSAFEAIVTGSESAGAAIKKAIGAHLMAEGKRMFILSLREAAEAIASLAIGDVRGAASHGLAAAKFGVAAGIAGYAASELGAGRSSAAGAGAGASASGVGLGGSTQQSAPIVRNYFFGSEFGTETPQGQARRFRQAERAARSREHDATGVEYG